MEVSGTKNVSSSGLRKRREFQLVERGDERSGGLGGGGREEKHDADHWREIWRKAGRDWPGNPREHYRIGTRGRVRVTRPRAGKQRRKGILWIRERLRISRNPPSARRFLPSTCPCRLPSRTQPLFFIRVFKSNILILDRILFSRVERERERQSSTRDIDVSY